MYIPAQLITFIGSRGFVYAVGFGMGGLTAKVLVERRERLRYVVLLEEELAKTKQYYKILNKKEEFSEPPQATWDEKPTTNIQASTYQERATVYSSGADVEETKASKKASKPKATTSLPKTDEERTERLKAKHDNNEPFEKDDMTLDWSVRIDKQQFLKRDHGWDQKRWVYYLEDDTMADEHNRYVSDWQQSIDSKLVDGLSSASTAETVIYVRDSVMCLEYEVVLETGSFSSMMGVEDSYLEHNERSGPKVKRFRPGDYE